MINSETKLIGLLGWPVSHSLSPVIHNAAFQYKNINYIYVALPVTQVDLQNAVKGLKALSFQGANVTIPHKERVIKYLDGISKDAKIIGAVNTIVREGKRLIGYNTDAVGFIKSLIHNGFSPDGCRALVIGAGGAARAVAVALALEGAKKIFIYNRSRKKAEQLEQSLNTFKSGIADVVRFLEEELHTLKPFDLVINTTPLGMEPNVQSCPIKHSGFYDNNMVVYDLVYNPFETLFLKKAKERGCKVISGLDMLLYQGAEAFTLWTSCEAPVEIMRKKLENVIKGGILKNK